MLLQSTQAVGHYKKDDQLAGQTKSPPAIHSPFPQPLNYEGCVFSLFTAVKGEWMAGGDFVCPAN